MESKPNLPGLTSVSTTRECAALVTAMHLAQDTGDEFVSVNALGSGENIGNVEVGRLTAQHRPETPVVLDQSS